MLRFAGSDMSEKQNFFSRSDLIASLALGVSIFNIHIEYFDKGSLKVSHPSHVYIASAREVQVQDNYSDKLMVSFSIHNDSAIHHPVNEVTLSIKNQDGEKLEFLAEGKFDELKNLKLYRFMPESNENYSLIGTSSIDGRDQLEANYLFFYRCDSQWHGEKYSQDLVQDICKDKPEIFQLDYQPGSPIEYKAKIHVDAPGVRVKDTCFTFHLTQEPQTSVLDESLVYKPMPCYRF